MEKSATKKIIGKRYEKVRGNHKVNPNYCMQVQGKPRFKSTSTNTAQKKLKKFVKQTKKTRKIKGEIFKEQTENLYNGVFVFQFEIESLHFPRLFFGSQDGNTVEYSFHTTNTNSILNL